MNVQRNDLLFSGVVALVGILLLVLWLNAGYPRTLAARIPGQDGAPPQAASGGGEVAGATVVGQPKRGDGTPSAVAGEWPGFRGTHRDGICDDGVRLTRQWPAAGPPVLWRIEVGEGYASPAISSGCAYFLDYDEASSTDTMRCLSLDDGREIWRNSYPVPITRNHGITRTVPVIAGDHVITIGPRCHVVCWDAKTGESRWMIDLVREHKAIVPQWYTGQCPLLDQDRLILAPCGDSLLIAVDPRTGSVIWKTPNPRRWAMTHVSIVPMDIGGRRTYVYCGSGGVAGIAADDGSLLWDTTVWPVQFAHAPSPLVLPGDRLLLSSGYGSKTGALLLQLHGEGDKLRAEVASELTPQQFNSEQQTPILYQEHIFGVRKRGGGQLVCMDLNGKEIWNTGADRFGHGPYMIADGLVLAMDNAGRVALAEASVDRYQRLASYQAFDDGHDAWGPMSLAGGRLILRDLTRMICLDIGAK